MTMSPGHKDMPDHKVEETHQNKKMQVIVNDTVIAESSDVIKVAEDGHQDRYYFPRSDVKMEHLIPSDKTSECPFKGTAHYFSLKTEDTKIDDAVWTYEDPFDEHKELSNRLAFDEDKISDISIKEMAA